MIVGHKSLCCCSGVEAIIEEALVGVTTFHKEYVVVNWLVWQNSMDGWMRFHDFKKLWPRKEVNVMVGVKTLEPVE